MSSASSPTSGMSRPDWLSAIIVIVVWGLNFVVMKWGLAKLSLSQKRDVLDLFTKSARSFLDSWFESEAVKAAFGFDAVTPIEEGLPPVVQWCREYFGDRA